MAGDRAPAFVPPAPQPCSERGDQSAPSASLERGALMGCNWAAARGKGAQCRGRRAQHRGRAGLGVQMETQRSASRAGRAAAFLQERDCRRAGIDLSSLPISLKFQINKIHFSAPLPSPPPQTKEKQFPAVCSELLSPSPGAPSPLRAARRHRGAPEADFWSPRDAAMDGAWHRNCSTWAL